MRLHNKASYDWTTWENFKDWDLGIHFLAVNLTGDWVFCQILAALSRSLHDVLIVVVVMLLIHRQWVFELHVNLGLLWDPLLLLLLLRRTFHIVLGAFVSHQFAINESLGVHVHIQTLSELFVLKLTFLLHELHLWERFYCLRSDYSQNRIILKRSLAVLSWFVIVLSHLSLLWLRKTRNCQLEPIVHYPILLGVAIIFFEELLESIDLKITDNQKRQCLQCWLHCQDLGSCPD